MAEAEEKNNNFDRKLQQWMPEAIVISALSAVAYLGAYQYEKSFAAVFQIPTELIELNTTKIVSVAATILTALGVFIFFIELTLKILPKKKFGELSKPIAYLLLVIVLYSIYFTLIPLSTGDIWVAVTVLISYVVWTFIKSVIGQRDKKDYAKKFEAQKEQDEKTDFNIKLLSFMTPEARRLFVIVGFLFLSVYKVSGDMGRSEAINKKDFLVLKTSPEAVVLRIYGDKMICAPFDRKTKEIQKSLFILKTSDNLTALVFNSERIGPFFEKLNKN